MKNKLILKIFDIQKTQLDRDRANSTSPIKLFCKKTILSSEIEDMIISEIKEKYLNYSPMRQFEILELARDLSKLELSDSWVTSFLKRHIKEISTVTANTLEDSRSEVKIEEIDNYLNLLNSISDMIHPSLLINIDETGNSESTLKSFQAVIPKEFELNTCYFKFDRTQKNITLINSISLIGDLLIPGIVIPLLSIPKEIDYCGFIDGKDAVILTSNSGYITSEIFLNYFLSVIIPYINASRSNFNLDQSTALILMDNCRAHITENLNQICSQNNILILTFPPHTSHLLQPLDLVIFGLFKRKKVSLSWYSQFPEIVQRIAEISNRIRSVSTPENIRSSFRRSGIYVNYSQIPHTIKIIPDEIQNMINGQVALGCSPQITPDLVLSKKRRKQNFGFINNFENYLNSKGICSLCFSTIKDDYEFLFEEDFEEEEEFLD